MKQMTADSYRRARHWLDARARPLDAALFAWRFEGGDREAVRRALATYQNADGGFGHGLEPDVRLDDSSVIATTIAMQVLRRIDADANDDLVRGGIAYLLGKLDRRALAWRNVPANVNEAPHAPWWQPEAAPAAFTANPGAEIVGHFHHWRALVPTDLLGALTDAALEHLAAHADDMVMHDLLCYEWLRRTVPAAPEARQAGATRAGAYGSPAPLPRVGERLGEGVDRNDPTHHRISPSPQPSPLKGEGAECAGPAVLQHTMPIARRLVQTDPAKWTGYELRPLQMVAARDSPYFPSLREAVEANLDHLVDTQQPDGAWPVHWSWGDEADAAWQRAKRDWQGWMIVDHLEMLDAFGRLNIDRAKGEPDHG